MRTKQILEEIKKLPIRKRIYVIEKAIHSIRTQEDRYQLKKAADTLVNDYKADKELTAFTELDFEDIYETR